MVLLVVDCQKALITDELLWKQIFIQNVKDMIAAARKNHVEVIHVIHDDGAGRELTHGMPGFEIYDEFRPESGERVFEKCCNSAFRNTGLDVYLFALLALGGDVGCSTGPTVVGFVSGAAGDNLKMGILAGAVFPAVLLLGIVLCEKNHGNSQRNRA